MNRVAKLICWFGIIEMIVVGFGAISSRWGDIVHQAHTIGPLGWRVVPTLVAFPILAIYSVFRLERRLKPPGMELSAAQRRTTEIWVIAALANMAGMQNWFAAILARHQMLTVLNASPQPVAMLVGGALLVVFGNAAAKFAPPTGPAAPDPGAWIRVSLRSGWAAVLSGIAIMIAAFAPVGVRSIIVLMVAPPLIASTIANRRLLRRRSGPQAPA